MKSPDEIKKGMECCITDNCKECPYYPLYEVFGCKLARATDALALIQQLQAQKDELLEKVEQLKEERDAAVKDMYAECACDVCKHNDRTETICHRGIEVDDCFEWRGVQKENH